MELKWKNEWTTPTVVGVVSFGIGAAIGYGIAQYRSKLARTVLENIRETLEDNQDENQLELELEASDSDEEHIQHVENDWSTSRIVQENEDSMETIILEEDTEIEVADFRAVARAAFPMATPEWDWDVEIAKRTSEVPYIIHYEEFMAEESGYQQTTLTYYRGDNILLDEKDVPLYDMDKIVGQENLIHGFGKGSQDPNIVYVRNDRLEGEYEILLDTGYYQVEVLGEELEHSFEKKPPMHKFRD